MTAHGWRTRDNRHELKQKRFRHAKRRSFFTWRKVRKRNATQRGCAVSTLGRFKDLNEDLSNLI